MAIDRDQKNIEDSEEHKKRRGNRVPRKVESGINNLPGAADDEVGIRIGSLIPMEGALNMGNIQTDVVKPSENASTEKIGKPKEDRRENIGVPVDAITWARGGGLSKEQSKALEASIYGTNSLRELDVLEDSLKDDIKENPHFRRILKSQRNHLYGEKAKNLDAEKVKATETTEETVVVAEAAKIEHNENEEKVNTGTENTKRDTSLNKETKMAETGQAEPEVHYTSIKDEIMEPAFPENPPDNPHEEIKVSDGSPTGYPDGSVEFSETKETEEAKTFNEQMVEKLIENGTLISPAEMKKSSSDLVDKWESGELTAEEYRKSVEELTVNLEKMDRVKNAKGESWEFLQELLKTKDDIKADRERFDQLSSELEEELLNALLENIEEASDIDRINGISELLSENENNMDPYYFRKLERMVSKIKDSAEQEELREGLSDSREDSSEKVEPGRQNYLDYLAAKKEREKEEKGPEPAKTRFFVNSEGEATDDLQEQNSGTETGGASQEVAENEGQHTEEETPRTEKERMTELYNKGVIEVNKLRTFEEDGIHKASKVKALNAETIQALCRTSDEDTQKLVELLIEGKVLKKPDRRGAMKLRKPYPVRFPKSLGEGPNLGHGSSSPVETTPKGAEKVGDVSDWLANPVPSSRESKSPQKHSKEINENATAELEEFYKQMLNDYSGPLSGVHPEEITKGHIKARFQIENDSKVDELVTLLTQRGVLGAPNVYDGKMKVMIERAQTEAGKGATPRVDLNSENSEEKSFWRKTKGFLGARRNPKPKR